MKRFLAILIISLLVLTSLSMVVGCDNSKEVTNITIVVPDGAPALSIAKLLYNKPQYENYNITYQIVDGATDISAKIINNEATFAIAPTNILANLYNKGSDIQLISVNVYGVLYMVGLENITELSQLKGKVVYNIGRGGTPDLTFKYILSQNDIEYVESENAVLDKVALHYVSSGAELIPLLKTGVAKFGILGEPAVTQALTKVPSSYKLFDIQSLWAESSNNLAYPQASLVGNKDFISNNEDFVKWFINELKENDEWIVENPELSKNALVEAESKNAGTINYTAELIKSCNIKFKSAKEAKDEINKYLSVISEFDISYIGGKLPDDEFYYIYE